MQAHARQRRAGCGRTAGQGAARPQSRKNAAGPAGCPIPQGCTGRMRQSRRRGRGRKGGRPSGPRNRARCSSPRGRPRRMRRCRQPAARHKFRAQGPRPRAARLAAAGRGRGGGARAGRPAARGDGAVERGECAGAPEAHEEAVRIDPRSIRARLERGKALLDAGRSGKGSPSTTRRCGSTARA